MTERLIQCHAVDQGRCAACRDVIGRIALAGVA